MRTLFKTAAATALAAGMSLPLTTMATPVTTVDFNNPTSIASDGHSLTQAGFTVTGSDGGLTLGGNLGSPAYAYDGTPYFWSKDSEVTLKSASGTLFSLSSFEASEYRVRNYGGESKAPSIKVTGILANGDELKATFTMDRINDGTGAQIDFQTFTLPTTFSGLKRIVFKGGDSTDYFGIDNIALSTDSVARNAGTSAIPEPATLGLAGLALLMAAGSAARSRKRRA